MSLLSLKNYYHDLGKPGFYRRIDCMQNFYIADATYENETTGKKTLIICKSDKIACKPRILTDNSHIFLSYKDVLANLIMKLAVTKTLPTEFYFEEERYTLISYRPYQEEFIFNDYRPKKKRKSQLVNKYLDKQYK